MANSSRALISEKQSRIAGSKYSSAARASSIVKHSLAILDKIGSVRDRVTKQAHASSKPKSKRTIDRSDFVAALESVELAKRVAAMSPADIHKASPAERAAALAMPALAGIPDSLRAAWSDEVVRRESPEMLALHDADGEILSEMSSALEIAKIEFRREAGFQDSETGGATPRSLEFEREAVKDTGAESEKMTAAARADAVFEAAKALPRSERIKFGGDLLDFNTNDLYGKSAA